MIDKAKQALRIQMLERRQRMTDAEWQFMSDGITQGVLQDPDFQRSQNIFIYYSVDKEMSTHALIARCLQSGKNVCIPRCGEHRTMSACQIHSPEDLEPGVFHILAPKLYCPIIPPEQLQFIIVPCLCADLQGYRVGYGGGYYDRFLQFSTAITAVACPTDFLIAAVPIEHTDIRCHKIATESGVRLAHEK